MKDSDDLWFGLVTNLQFARLLGGGIRAEAIAKLKFRGVLHGDAIVAAPTSLAPQGTWIGRSKTLLNIVFAKEQIIARYGRIYPGLIDRPDSTDIVAARNAAFDLAIRNAKRAIIP